MFYISFEQNRRKDEESRARALGPAHCSTPSHSEVEFVS